MHIAGGLYRELCMVPPWDFLFGSGGRAAAALAVLSPASTLHSYSEDSHQTDLDAWRNLGIDLRLSPRSTAIAFAYFHPLSRPHVEPSTSSIAPQPPLRVEGDAVLRFGFLEGDAIVTARHATYDPQTWRDPPPFAANGSTAEHLAIVLNELELRSTSGLNNLEHAAAYLMEQQDAEVVVAKGGTRGAVVFERSGRRSQIPAYKSSRVFKIGTGDVFSAVFAHLWSEVGLDPADAADSASRSVSDYCDTRHLPVTHAARLPREPVGTKIAGPVLLEGAVNTIGCRYAMEEARFGLRELGLEVICPALDSLRDNVRPTAAALVLADGIDQAASVRLQVVAGSGIPVVVLREAGGSSVEHVFEKLLATVTDDFTSSLYLVAWAAVGSSVGDTSSDAVISSRALPSTPSSHHS